MSLDARIALFWLGVYLVLCLLRAKPGSIIARVMLAGIGPIQHEGELRSRYLRRQAVFALGWLAQLLVIAAVLILICERVPAPTDAETFTVVAMFALVIGTGMAVLGALLAWLGSIKARLIGPDPAWHAPVVPVDDSEDFEPSGLE
jgi:uncharacterized membrane protein YdbT with pleckstrin-like domain